MAKKMLIDASQPEETRVAVVAGTRIEEFDFESATKKQLTGNIYLAKVVRIEPSLQAAFVEYGGNRHGFLAFSEIHPDYYQIPTADRQALLARHAAAARKSAETYDEEPREKPAPESAPASEGGEPASADAHDDHHDHHEHGDHDHQHDDHQHDSGDHHDIDEYAAEDHVLEAVSVIETIEPDHSPEPAPVVVAEEAAPIEDVSAEAEAEDESVGADAAPAEQTAEARSPRSGRRGRFRRKSEPGDGDDAPQEIESLGGDDNFDDMPRPRFHGGRPYKIQEVIKRRQILLIQVVKEERGTKGAALTTYLSLAGRYCVLMPNTGRGGGISRKITNAVDRKRLKSIATELEVPEGMGLIVRTAGANRTKVEIKRDFEYLLRLWENVRETTLNSSAPALILEEGSLIKRAIRDLYSKDIESVQVEGEEGYREAKEFMRMLMPSHAKNVQAYRDTVPLFLKTQVEAQLDSLFSPQVQLKSGGYVVIDQTEALVAIDVNSGRSTREHNIEDTALKTNLEAAEEVARQLRLRDLAGLIVVDFIDMEDPRNNRAVERRLKDALKADRARIQVGRISAFGLLEMSRQRLRSSVMEISSNSCPMCNGAGVVRSVESTALHVIRGIEEEGLNGRSAEIVVRLPAGVAMFLLNQKRETLRRIEERYGFAIIIEIDHSLIPPDYRIERFGVRAERPGRPEARRNDAPPPEEPADLAEADEEDDEDEADVAEAAERPVSGGSSESDDNKRRRRRRRRRRGGRREDGMETGDAVSAEGEDRAEAEPHDRESHGHESPHGHDGHGSENGESRRRRRGRRGGRRQRNPAESGSPIQHAGSGDQPDVPPDAWPTLPPAQQNPSPQLPLLVEPAPRREPESAIEAEPVLAHAEPDLAPNAPRLTSEGQDAEAGSGPPKRGWWRRTLNL